ncbi:hypothetical protein MRX96_009396 [Rhipicephalus microplus]
MASKQPRLPSDALKLIIRPRGGLVLSKITNIQLFEAVCAAANFPKVSIRGDDLIQQEEDSKQQDQVTRRRITLKRSSRWDHHRSGSTQRKHRDRSSSFPPLGADSSHKSPRPSSSSRHLPLLKLRQVYRQGSYVDL